MTLRGTPSESWVAAVCIALAFAFVACDRDVEQDPELHAIACEENVYLAQSFGIPEEDMTTVAIRWGSGGDSYKIRGWREIVITHDARGQWFLREHVRHEMMHLMANVSDWDTEYNGRVIHDYVKSWRAPGEKL